MSNQWYWKKHGGIIVGPISTDELHDHIKKRRVKDDDSFRIEETDAWLSAAQIKNLFQSETAAGASKSAADALASSRKLLPQHSAGTASGGGAMAPVWDAGGRFVGVLSLWAGWISSAIEFLLKVVSRPRAKTSLAFLLVMLAAILLKDFRFDRQVNDLAYHNLLSAWERMESMRKRSASETEWKAFAAEQLKWLDPQIEEFRQRAAEKPINSAHWSVSSRESARVRREILGASEQLAAIVREQPHGGINQKHAEYFQRHMHDITSSLSGELNKKQSLSGQPKGQLAVSDFRGREAAAQAAEEMDPLLLGIVIADMGIVAGFLSWWIYRRKRAYG